MNRMNLAGVYSSLSRSWNSSPAPLRPYGAQSKYMALCKLRLYSQDSVIFFEQKLASLKFATVRGLNVMNECYEGCRGNCEDFFVHSWLLFTNHRLFVAWPCETNPHEKWMKKQCIRLTSGAHQRNILKRELDLRKQTQQSLDEAAFGKVKINLYFKSTQIVMNELKLILEVTPNNFTV